MPSRRVAFLPGLLLLCCACASPDREAAPPGVAVDFVQAGGAGERAGLQAGDALVSFRRRALPPAHPRGASGPIRSCAELAEVEIEQAPRGPVELGVRRAGERELRTIEIPPGAWRVEPGPGGGEGCAAFARARREERERRWAAAAGIFAAAAAPAQERGDFRFAALAFQAQGNALIAAEDLAGAERALTAALHLRQRAAPGSLTEAVSWHALGRLAQLRGDLDRSDEAFRRALALRSRLAPESVERTWTINNLGINAMQRGDFAAARRHYRQALAITRRRSPGSLEEAQVLNNLGLLARSEGEAEVARRWFSASARISLRVAPASPDLARTQTNLGLIALERGDLAEAEERLRDALQRFEMIAPEGVDVALVLNALGAVARERFANEDAEALFRRALAIRSRLIPGSAAEAESLSSLAGLANNQNRLDEAEHFARRAFAIRTRIAPEGQDAIVSLAMLSAIAQSRGHLEEAAALGERALARQRKLAPGAYFEGDILYVLGEVAIARKEWSNAESSLRRALEIRRRLEPSSRAEADIWSLLGQVYARTGRETAAGEAFVAAVEALEAQVGRLGGSDEARSLFQAGVVQSYWDLLAFQVGRGEDAAALHTLERSRARSLLALLAQRDLTFRADVPAPLLDQQQRLERTYEEVQEEISRLDPRETARLDALLVRLTRLRGERADLTARIARASPRYASLRHPRPLDLAGVRRALDPGTVLLSYCVTEEETFLFLVTPEGAGAEPLRVIRIPAGRGKLGDEVAVFRSLLLRGKDAPGAEEAPGAEKAPGAEEALLAQGRRLYALLVAPAESVIAGAGRVLISPDGPLHTLPFSALVRPGPAPAYLAAWKPVHTVLSATLYAELRRGRRASPAAGPLVVFADPRYRPVSAAAAGDTRAAPLARYRQGLTMLPYAREEAQALARLYGNSARIYTGALATEERVKQLPAAPGTLHFATHALLDVRSPLDSALALAAPASGHGENGLLQAWEIFEQVRIDADLVTLSACETGLGREAAGEGLIGLTRAFQYAGARSVLASLWAVSDRSTAQLMARFYALRRAGRPKDAALAEAQRELLRGGGPFSHPYDWAGFELTGDWR